MSLVDTNYGSSITPDLMTSGDPNAGIIAATDTVNQPGYVDQTGGSSGMLGNLGNWISNNPGTALGIVGGGGMLLKDAFGTSDQQKEMSLLQQNATGAGTMATALQAPLFSGVLPPGAQTALNTQKANSIANVRSNYAKVGMSGSTGEADALNAVNQATTAQQFNMADRLFQQAAGYAKLQSQDYLALLEEQRAQDQDFSNALSKFVSALAGSGTSGGSGGTGGGGGGGGSSSGGGIGGLISSIFS